MIDDRFFFCPLFRKIDTNLRNFDFSDNRIYAGIPAQDHHNGGGRSACPSGMSSSSGEVAAPSKSISFAKGGGHYDQY